MGIYNSTIKKLKGFIDGNEKAYKLDPNDPYFDTKAKDTADTFGDMIEKSANPKEIMRQPYNFEKEKNELEKNNEWQFHDSDATPEPAAGGSSMVAPKNNYMDMFNKSHRSELDVLLKPLQKTSEDEITAAKKFALYENKDENLKKQLNGRISSWYDNMYGTNPVKLDASGRQIEPQAKMASSTGAAMTKDGLDMPKSLAQVSQQMSAVDDDDTPEKGVSALQKNLNALGANPQLKVDNELGPKTSLQTRQYLAENGYHKLSKAFKNKLYMS